MHPRKVRLTSWHRPGIALEVVIVLVVVVPERAADIDGIVADGKRKSAADSDAFWQIERKREPICRAIVRVEDVAGGEVIKGDPVVGCVADGYLLAVAQVGDADEARHGAVLIADAASAKITVTHCI